MNRKLLIAMIVPCLIGCVNSPAKDDAPASDLDALVSEVKENAAPRTLPNGKTYCVEDTRTERERDDCALDLEDTLFLSEGDKRRIVSLVERAVARIKLARSPCGFWRGFFRPRECKVD